MKKILMIMTGSIAAYKACGVLSNLKQKGFDVEVIMTPSCLKFVGTSTVEGLTGKPPLVDMYDPGFVMDHIHLQRWADLILVAPATAHFINRIALGIGDDLASTLFLAHDFQKPFLIAPAMNTKMYLHPTTQKSMQSLKEMGVHILEAASGVLACGETGWGRLLEPQSIVAEVENFLKADSKTSPHKTRASASNKQIGTKNKTSDLKNLKSLNSRKILITAGGTSEPIDAVRFLTNESTGRTGYRIAQNLVQLGYDVHLLLAEKNSVSDLEHRSESLQINFFSTFQSLSDLMKAELFKNDYHAVIHAAAVSDFSIDSKSFKTKIDSTQDMTLKLKRNPKLIQSVKKWSRNKNVKLIGFKLTANLADKQIDEKVNGQFQKAHVDLVIQNDISQILRKPGQNFHRFRMYHRNGSFQEIQNIEDLIYALSNYLNGGKQ
ncbi:MAG: bifunctional phosphopantothenoylcysteine decarboxylase/phosphopantothenate synthase [Pseudobdellovibrionaceae bacterium]